MLEDTTMHQDVPPSAALAVGRPRAVCYLLPRTPLGNELPSCEEPEPRTSKYKITSKGGTQAFQYLRRELKTAFLKTCSRLSNFFGLERELVMEIERKRFWTGGHRWRDCWQTCIFKVCNIFPNLQHFIYFWVPQWWKMQILSWKSWQNSTGCTHQSSQVSLNPCPKSVQWLVKNHICS